MSVTPAFCLSGRQLCFDLMSGDVFKLALYSSAAAMDGATATYTATDEITGTNWPAGGVVLTGFVVGANGLRATLTFDDISVLNATLADAAAVMVYNASRADAAMLVNTITGGPLTATNGTLVLDLSAELLRI